jgi:hypothetical protein
MNLVHNVVYLRVFPNYELIDMRLSFDAINEGRIASRQHEKTMQI